MIVAREVGFDMRGKIIKGSFELNEFYKKSRGIFK
jgi:hypothetical protein